MKIDLTGIIIMCGNFGSGKTETAINLALHRRAQGLDVAIADLDLVNPYFRTREAKTVLEDAGVNIILPPDQYLHADLPIVSPKIAGIIKHPSSLTILDAGGDASGMRVIASLNNILDALPVQMLWVINPFRPETSDINGCLKIQDRIQTTANLKITGLIGNANLIHETLPEHICEGYRFLNKVSTTTGLEINFITCPVNLIAKLAPGDFTCPILEINRKLNPPWKQIA